MHRRRFLETSLQIGGLLTGAHAIACPPSAADAESPLRPRSATPVVDAYSACVNLDELEKGRINVVIQAVTSEELLVRIPPNSGSVAPPPGLDIWENVFHGKDAVTRVGQYIDEELQHIAANPDRIALATSTVDARKIVADGKIALILMLKSGWINNDLEVLRMYHQRGIRVMAPCHLASFDWSDSSAELRETPGLSDFGRGDTRECNPLATLADPSHAPDAPPWHALETTDRPVIATHSRCRTFSDSMRDLTDDMLVAIARTGGVSAILAATPRTGAEVTQARLKRDRALAENYPDPFELAAAKRQDAIVWGTKLNLQHIDHAVQTAGINHVAIASHCQSVPQWREFADTLTTHGYRADETEKLLGGNVLRVLEETIG